MSQPKSREVKDLRVLVVGAGSIGKRHIKNLIELGIDSENIIAVDRDIWRATSPNKDTGQYIPYETKLDTALRFPFHAALICTPTASHCQVAQQILRHQSIPLFIEKPIGNDLEDARRLLEAMDLVGTWGCVGYSMRFHPAIDIIKSVVSGERIGLVRYARAEVGQHLADWHPNEPYTTWYMGKASEGGGALLDLSHEFDYLKWLFGPYTNIKSSQVTQVALVDTDVDDLVEVTASLRDCPVASIHLDLVDRSYNRRVRIVGSHDTLEWIHGSGCVRLLKRPQSYYYVEERNIQYMAEMSHFLRSVIKGQRSEPLVSIEDATDTLRVLRDAKTISTAGL